MAAPAADRRGRGRGREGGRTEWMTSTNTCSSNPWPLSQKGEATSPRLLSSPQPPRAPRDPAPAPPGDWDPAHQWTYMRSPRRMRAQQSSARRDMAASLVTLPSRMGRCRKSSLSCGGWGGGWARAGSSLHSEHAGVVDECLVSHTVAPSTHPLPLTCLMRWLLVSRARIRSRCASLM